MEILAESKSNHWIREPPMSYCNLSGDFEGQLPTNVFSRETQYNYTNNYCYASVSLNRIYTKLYTILKLGTLAKLLSKKMNGYLQSWCFIHRRFMRKRIYLALEKLLRFRNLMKSILNINFNISFNPFAKNDVYFNFNDNLHHIMSLYLMY